MLKVFNTECSGRFSVVFNHPDDSSAYYDISVVCDDIWDDNFSQDLCKQVWELYNKYGYYHEMVIRSDYWIDNCLYVHETVYNGYDITSEKTIQRYELKEKPFEVNNGILFDKE